jgi:hypothetical protein
MALALTAIGLCLLCTALAWALCRAAAVRVPRKEKTDGQAD